MHKRILSVLLTVVLLIGLIAVAPGTAYAKADGTGWYKVTSTNGLRLRKEATTDSESLVTMPYQALIYISELKGSWGKTTYDNKTGWTLLDYAQKTDTSADFGNVDVYARLDELRKKFPDGKYWNHVGGKNNPDGYTSSPCTHHRTSGCSWKPDGCDCNSFDSSIQCHGFSLKIGYDLFGTSARGWVKRTNTLQGLCVGDIVRIGDWHTVTIIGMKGDSFIVVDGNWNYGCGIDWDRAMKKTKITNYGSYYVLHYPGNNYLLLDDTTAPSVSGLSATISGDRKTINVSCNASDSGVLTRVDVKVTSPTGKTVTKAAELKSGVASVSIPLSSFGVENGTYSVTATAQDSMNNKKSASTSVKLSAFTLAVTPATAGLYVGGTTTLTAKTTGTNPGTSPVWTTSDAKVATVSSSGVVTAVGKGTAVITANINGTTAKSTITVKAPVISKLTASVGSDGKTINSTCTLSYKPAATNVSFKLTSPTGKTKTVSSGISGDVSVASFLLSDVANESGKYTVTATVTDPDGATTSASTVLNVGVASGKAVAIAPITASVNIDSTLSVGFTVGGATASSVTWKSSDTSVATVSGGKVTGLKLGTVTITATVGGASTTCTVTVNPARLGGSTRIDTANLIAECGWKSGAQNVVLANANNFADALAGVPLAHALNAPILLSLNNNGKLDASVVTELQKLKPKTVWILGGSGVISAETASSLEKSGYAVKRVAGATRFETAVLIAQELENVTGKKPSEVFFASSANFPDALSGSTAAALTGSPILYAPPEGAIDETTAGYVSDSDVPKVTILGGTAAVSSAAETSAAEIGVENVTRISGKNRYDTCFKICSAYKSCFIGTGAAFATGESFPDALAGGAFAASKGIPVVLIGSSVNTDLAAFAKDKGRGVFYVFGGTKPLPDSIIDKYTK